MRVAVMQPYFIPYLGYFQLFQSCDLFVYYVDIQAKKRSWINRNRLIINGEPRFCTIPTKKYSLDTKIEDLVIADEFGIFRSKTLSRFDHNYSHAPAKHVARELLDSILVPNETNLVSFLVKGLNKVYSALALERQTIFSSQVNIDPRLSGQDRVIAIVQAVGGSTYINLPGGKSLYKSGTFNDAGIKLQFLDPYVPLYQTARGEIFPRMSVIDTVAHLGIEEVNRLLNQPVAFSEA